jgi:gas vesicle protein
MLRSLIFGAAIGAGLMYLFDPRQGPDRREVLKDRLQRGRQQAEEAADRGKHMFEDVRDQARDTVNSVRSDAEQTLDEAGRDAADVRDRMASGARSGYESDEV